MRERHPGLYDPAEDRGSCGVGLIARKDGVQSHEPIEKAHRALCSVPHRGGMSAEGVGDGGGVSVDLSVRFFSALAGRRLERGAFGVGNFFLPVDPTARERGEALVQGELERAGLRVVLVRDVPTDDSVLHPAALAYQQPIRQWVFEPVPGTDRVELDRAANRCLLAVEALAYTDPELDGLYPISLSARTQVLKGRLNAHEVLRYFTDLTDPAHEVRSLYFHTRFSTNTDPHPTMAQPFRFVAHNGELNTDRKNRLSENARARARDRRIVRPRGQSDSARFDQTLQSRVVDDGLDLITAIVAMMPPAWENDRSLSGPVRAMLEYFALSEECNDGPAALVFADGDVIGARLDRLGLRPLRTCETDDYFCVSSEAGQFPFAPEQVRRRGRIEAGGMAWWDFRDGRARGSAETLDVLAARADYASLLDAARIRLADLPEPPPDGPGRYDGDLTRHQRYVAYSLDQECFRFLMDPMLATGVERVSAMGYGNAINALSDQEGGVAKYFSQRFAQVTNPPLDSVRERDGMTLRLTLGAPSGDGDGDGEGGGEGGARQITLDTPVLSHRDMVRIREQDHTPVRWFDLLHTPDTLEATVESLCAEVVAFARDTGGVAVLTDRHVARERAAVPALLAVAAVNQALIGSGLRARVSVVVESGQICSSHHVATTLGFGAAAVYPLAVQMRAEEVHGTDDADAAFGRFRAAAEKALLKTMGRVGLCRVESYIGGEFFEPAYLDTDDEVLRRWFPNLVSPVGGVGFAAIARAARDWHARALTVTDPSDVPLLGLFKERSDGAGHSYGATAVRGFVDMTEERLMLDGEPGDDTLRLLPLDRLADAFGIADEAYRSTSLEALTPAEIDAFAITPGYRDFVRMVVEERHRRPAALRDVLALPADVTWARTLAQFAHELDPYVAPGNTGIVVRGLHIEPGDDGEYRLRLMRSSAGTARLGEYLAGRFGAGIGERRIDGDTLVLRADGAAADWLGLLTTAPASIPLDTVQPASEITRTLASGAMSHGALVASAHEAVAHGTNMVGGMSNCGEGGEHLSRYGTIRGSRVKQFASGRFGVWAGYLADPMLEQIEIKIGQGAKPGEGGQLPGPKVTVDIAAARGATPGVELVSPPPHHDTYSIEDLAQLIHDCKAARVKVVVKLVSSEGIGTIAVGVAKAGADVINVAGNTGGTGAASVTSLKYAGRSAEIGVAEVHQALCANGLRAKVELRCSGAHQTAGDVLVSALLGADGFEFGTTALMMLRCVMAKNCNVKCPAGLTTNAEAFDGDPRALAQYLLNVSHEVREILARLGLPDLRAARGRADLLHLLGHRALVGRLDLRAMLHRAHEVVVEHPIYLEKNYGHDDAFAETLRAALAAGERSVQIDGGELGNAHKSVGGQLAVDVERMLNHDAAGPGSGAVHTDDRGRRHLAERTVTIRTRGSAGQSYGLLCNDGMWLEHTGTANDGVAKSACGGTVAVRSPGGGDGAPGENVLIGNFALFGATGGRVFVNGEAGDRFAVRNSGATAVVEGVGDFACEYMTNGAVLNLGGFGTGLGNGMSGGFVYQYDPGNRAAELVSDDSLVLGRVVDVGFHVEAVRLMLGWHVEATGSPRARRILDDFERESRHLVYGMPRALLLYQDAAEILAARTRRELVDELAAALAAHQLRRYKLGHRDAEPLLGGAVPGYGDEPNEEMYALLNSLTVLTLAQEVARARRPDDLEATTRTLLLTEDFAVVARLTRYARDALDGYTEEELAVLVSAKRVRDVKEALTRRNVRSVDGPGTYGWILHTDAANRAALGRIPGFEELFARQAAPGLVTAP